MSKKIALIGSDPELFIGSQGKVMSAIGLVGGTKDAPRPVYLGALQEDNVLLEFNIDPAGSLDDFKRNLNTVLAQAQDSITQYRLEVIAGLSSHLYSMNDLESFGHQAFVFGCEPDFNAWTMDVNTMPYDVDPGLRTAGGHIHIGYDHIEEATWETSADVARMCDIFLGLPSVLMDKDDRRRQLYGKAGAVRFKPYGVEYRSLSNFWIFSDVLQGWAYENAQLAFEKRGEVKAYCDAMDGDTIQHIINTGDKKAAQAALDLFQLKVA